MRCERCGAYDWTSGQDRFKLGHYRSDGRYCLGTLDQRQQIIDLKQELLERAEAHEEAERKVETLSMSLAILRRTL
jgi:hypothetical protein